MPDNFLKAYILAVDMGYGHQRAAFPLSNMATTPSEWGIKEPYVISVNNYPGMPPVDRKRWLDTQIRYEKISRMNSIPFWGGIIFKIMDYFQSIESFYPRRDLSRPTLQSARTYNAIKKGFGKHLIDILNKNPLPLVCTFFIPAILAEGHGYNGKIYCLCTDTDISRAWVPFNPKESRIIYLAPSYRVKERLLLYGIKPENIIITGFPLPQENIGDNKKQDILRQSLAGRLSKLDPNNLYRAKYQPLIFSYLSKKESVGKDRPLSITFAVGGAGAQSDIGVSLLRSLRQKIVNREVRLNLIAGTSKKVYQIFDNAVRELKFNETDQSMIKIVYDTDKITYFKKFNQILLESDILWTKPSELSFYAGLGLPIIMSKTLGSQEKANRNWLLSLGAGFDALDPQYTHEWLDDLLQSGCLAQAAMNGFLRVPQNAVLLIEDIVLRGKLPEINQVSL